MSIVTFEQYTEDLSERELECFPDVKEAIVQALSGSKEPLKQNDLLLIVNHHLYHNFCPIMLTGERLRKYVNYIRGNALLPLVATSKGYSLTQDEATIHIQIKSLKQRANAILYAANGLEQYLMNQKINT